VPTILAKRGVQRSRRQSGCIFHLGLHIRQIEAVKRLAVTAHGRVVAELVPPGAGTGEAGPYEQLVATGIIVPATEDGEGLPEWLDIHLSGGTVADLIDSDRGEP